MCAGKHASPEICVRGNNIPRETRNPATPGHVCPGQVGRSDQVYKISGSDPDSALDHVR